jgi:dihydroorotase
MKNWITDCAKGSFWISGANLIDPVAGKAYTGSVRVKAGLIAEVIEGPPTAKVRCPVLDAGGLSLAPGLIDMHVHLRDPGYEDRETVASGSRAAARGGVTTMACMPNTNPIIDNGSIVRLILEHASRAGLCRVLPVGAITRNSESETLADMGEMLDVGAVAFSDDGCPVTNPRLLANAMNLALTWDALLISHAEELSLSKNGIMHEGPASTRLGLMAIPREAEDIAVDRDIRLARMTGARLHIAHVSSGISVEIIRRAKADGVRVTAETAPHYLLLTDEALSSYDSHKKMNPPLREQSDQDALVAGLLDGTIDCIATDHAPHTAIDKEQELAYAPFGVIGLETSLAVVITRLVKTGLMDLPGALALMTSNPAGVLGSAGGRLAKGAPADLVLFDPDESWIVRGREMVSLSSNTPFEGERLSGRVRATFLAGLPVYLRETRKSGKETVDEESFTPHPWRDELPVPELG